MRRLLPAILAATLVSVLASSVALAAKPSNTCAAEASGYFIVDRDEWWDITVDGFEAEGIDVYVAGTTTFTDEFNQFAADVGFGSGAGLEEFVRVEQWAAIDHNENDLVCMKRRPITPGNPAYFFNGVDDQSSSPVSA
jgi:hypothetical protein